MDEKLIHSQKEFKFKSDEDKKEEETILNGSIEAFKKLNIGMSLGKIL